jgi:hypothetical protein
MPYHLEGRLLEVCTCGERCPCRPSGKPDGGTCNAVNAWHIDQGAIDGTDVGGLTLVALSRIHGHVLEGRPVAFYVDDRATAMQQEALMNVWTGKLGGPVADLAQLMGEVAGVERSEMSFEVNEGKGSLQVKGMLEARLAEPSHGEGSQRAVRHDDVCTTIPGSKAYAANATSYRVSNPTYDVDLDLRDYPVTEGHFRFDG